MCYFSRKGSVLRYQYIIIWSWLKAVGCYELYCKYMSSNETEFVYVHSKEGVAASLVCSLYFKGAVFLLPYSKE
jgi:hypothetical protein